MQIVVDGLMTHYQKQGSGKIVLLLHGWGDRLETFASLLPELGNYTVVSLDLPGFGTTQEPETTWNLDDYASFLKHFLEKVGTSDVYAVVGHSNGGALAIRALAKNDVAPQKLILLAASGVRDTAKLRRLVIKAIAKTGKVATFWLPQNRRQKLQKKLYGTVGSDMFVTPKLQETFKQTVRQDVQIDAAKLTLPVLLIYGDQDTATPLDPIGNRLHKNITNSRLEIIPGADHFVHQSQPKQVVKLIREFLA